MKTVVLCSRLLFDDSSQCVRDVLASGAASDSDVLGLVCMDSSLVAAPPVPVIPDGEASALALETAERVLVGPGVPGYLVDALVPPETDIVRVDPLAVPVRPSFDFGSSHDPSDIRAASSLEGSVILYCDDVEMDRNPFAAVQATRSLVDRGLNWVLLLEGDGAAMPDLHRYAEQILPRGRVRFLGPRPDIQNALAVADVLVSPAVRACVGRDVVLAAMMRRPVVSTGVQAMSNRVRGGVAVRPAVDSTGPLHLERLTQQDVAERVGEAMADAILAAGPTDCDAESLQRDFEEACRTLFFGRDSGEDHARAG